MKTKELAAEIVEAKTENTERLEVLAEKVEEVIAEVSRISGLSPDEVLNALVQRNQETQRKRGRARAKAELALLLENAERIEAETERILLEEAKG